jgi:hypothetical protein
MNTQVDSSTSEGRHGGNVLREPEIKNSTQTNTRAGVAEKIKPSTGFLSRRSFLGKSLAVGAGTIGAGLLANAPTARGSGGLTAGDEAILRFLAAAELIEADLWQQYNELGGIQDPEVPGGTGNPAYTAALQVLDGDMNQYVHDNTDDEITHAAFLNAYLASKGAEPVNLDQFRTLPSSQATGAQQIGRLTNLMQLTVDTSWWTRYRSDNKNPDFGDTFPQAIEGLRHGTVSSHTAKRRRSYSSGPPTSDRQHSRLPLRVH